jgi:sucrose-6-phosphate hydrolase SacC (GH32 family)
MRTHLFAGTASGVSGLSREAAALCWLWLACVAFAQPSWHPQTEVEVLLRGELESELAPHGQGNIYAPEVHYWNDQWWMWYGGQGADGHDRIHLAQSADGSMWQKVGVVLDCGDFNHVNDPTVVRVNEVWWMFYTVAAEGEMDEIAAATSRDGRQWEQHGTVIKPGDGDVWDSLKVGRPSVLHDGTTFRLWYDGQPTATAAAREPLAAAIRSEGRAVGYAESKDGLVWTRRLQPVFRQGAGAVQIAHVPSAKISAGNLGEGSSQAVAEEYWMVYESGRGVLWASSHDGETWQSHGFLVETSGGPVDRYGCVTPHLIANADELLLFFGAAARKSWDGNAIALLKLRRPGEQP